MFSSSLFVNQNCGIPLCFLCKFNQINTSLYRSIHFEQYGWEKQKRKVTPCHKDLSITNCYNLFTYCCKQICNVTRRLTSWQLHLVLHSYFIICHALRATALRHFRPKISRHRAPKWDIFFCQRHKGTWIKAKMWWLLADHESC